MSGARILPHLEADAAALQWGPWWVEIDGRRELVADRLKGWDYASTVRFEIQPTVDVERTLESSGLTNRAEVALVGLLDCRATGRRFTSVVSLGALAAGESNLICIEPEVGTIADEVELSAHLVFTGRGVPNRDGRAWRPGSRLAASTITRLRLEGDAARFPTEAVSFAALGLDPAAWSLHFAADDLADSFMGHVRLLVNTDHPVTEMLLGQEGETVEALQSVLFVDIARQMFVHVALTHEELDSDSWPEGSVGQVLDGLAREALAMDLSSLGQLVRQDPLLFERRLQAAFEFLGGAS